MTKREWTWLVRDERTLCLDGYPIQIIRHNATSYEVTCEGLTTWRGITLQTAKWVGQNHAADMDVFNPPCD